MKQWLIPTIVLASVAVVSAQAPTTAPASAQQVDSAMAVFIKRIEPALGDHPLRQKLKERHNTAVHLLQLRLDSYHKGIDDVSKVFEAARLVADAKMELVQNDSERQALLEQIIQVAKDFETRLEKQFQAGFGSAADVERARLGRETAEIELLKLKQGGAAPATRP